MNTFYILLISIFLLGCKKKEYPQQTVSSPEYYANGKLNQADFSLSAGIDDIQLTTKKYQNRFGVYEYISSLSSINSSSDTELKFKIVGHSKFNFHELESINDAIHIGSYTFAIDSIDSYAIDYNLYSYCSDTNSTSDWIFDTSTISSSTTNPINTSGLISGNTAETKHFSNGSTFTSIIQYPVTPDFVDNYVNLSLQTTNSTLIITPIINKDDFEDELELISFSFNGQTVSKTEPITTPFLNDGSYYFISAQFMNSKTSEIHTTNFNFSYMGDFEGSVIIGEIQTNVTEINTDNIKITYTKNGIIYKSSLADNTSNSFTISSVEDGPLSPTGKPTKKINAVFTGNLANTLNELDLIYFTNTSVRLVFEY